MRMRTIAQCGVQTSAETGQERKQGRLTNSPNAQLAMHAVQSKERRAQIQRKKGKRRRVCNVVRGSLSDCWLTDEKAEEVQSFN